MTEEYIVRAILYYTKEHTWARIMSDGNVMSGITDYAQRRLGNITYVELPEVGCDVKQMQPLGSIESAKSVSDIYSTISGKVKEVNNKVVKDPSLINRDPYDLGWLVLVKPLRLEEEIKNLMEAETYSELIKSKRVDIEDKDHLPVN